MEYKMKFVPLEDKPHPTASNPKLKDYPEIYNTYKNARQRIYRFENLYGASVIQDGGFSWFLETHPNGREIAVLKFADENDMVGSLCYSTPITDDVMNVESEEELQEVLKRIAAL